VSKKSSFAIAAASLVAVARRTDDLLAEALQRIYAFHVESVQMRLAPVKLSQDRRSFGRQRSIHGWF
jgi:hypothetical protein